MAIYKLPNISPLREIYFMLFILFVLILGSNVNAEELIQVRDINAKPRPIEIHAQCLLGDKEIIFADDGIHGAELWRGDGTVGNTVMVKDIRPGSIGSNPSGCGLLDGYAYFKADDGVTGGEFWRTDGTAAGTTLVKDIFPGVDGSHPTYMTLFGNRIFFSANDGVSGTELWASDGTDSGTVLVKDIQPGANSSFPESFVVLNQNRLFFRAKDIALGNEPFITDGTTGGTTLLKDINPGAGNSFITSARLIGSLILFGANGGGALGRELWRTDGTLEGTTLVKDIAPGAGNGFDSSDVEVYGGKYFFVGKEAATGSELWVSDGTQVGTTLLKDIYPGPANSSPTDFNIVNGKLYFTGINAASGREAWITDGTSGGTMQLTELATGPLDGVNGFEPSIVTSDGSRLVSPGNVYYGGPDIFGTDATVAGTQTIADLFPGSYGVDGYAANKTSAGISLGFPVPMDSVPGSTVFLSDGTPNGTFPHPGTLSSYTDSSTPVVLGELNGRIIFAANDGVSGYELWSSDGTEGGTSIIADMNPGSAWFVDPLKRGVRVGDYILFVGVKADTGAELWRTDGTPSGTMLVKDIETGPDSSFEFWRKQELKYVIGSGSAAKLLFGANTSSTGTELWISDGTTVGTNLLHDIRPGSDESFNVLDGAVAFVPPPGDTGLYFIADDGVTGSELWFSDGTPGPGGTFLVEDIHPGPMHSLIHEVTSIPSPGTGVVYRACEPIAGCEPWYANAPVAGSNNLFANIRPGASGSNPKGFTFTGIIPLNVLFSASDGVNGEELWISNGTALGTIMVKNISPGLESSVPEFFKILSPGVALFKACSAPGMKDCELWRTDGTALGTTRVTDLNIGIANSSHPIPIGVLNGVAYFYGIESETPIFNYGIFRSDGTEGGTRKILDLSFSRVGYEGLVLEPTLNALSTMFLLGGTKSQGFELFKVGDDLCPDDPEKTFPGVCGCGVQDELDADGDGSANCQDRCAFDSYKTVLGQCGCGTPDTDSDFDGTADCNDQCSLDAAKVSPGVCGCGTSDGDSNINAVADCLDALVPSLTPGKPKIRVKKKKLIVTMTAQSGVKYVVLYYIKKVDGKKRRKIKFRLKTSESNVLRMKRPTRGSTIRIKYYYEVPGASSLRSAMSPVAKKRIR